MSAVQLADDMPSRIRPLPAPLPLSQMLHESLQGFLAHVMLDPFGIGLRDERGTPNDFRNSTTISCRRARFLRELAPARGEKNRAIRQGRDKAFALQTLNRPRHRHVGDPEAAGQVDHPRFARRRRSARRSIST